MKICSRCVLPETYPGIRFDADGVCQYCLRYEKVPPQKHQEIKIQYKEKFEALINEVKGKGGYDALMAYSGGKDSTYTLNSLREDHGLKVLAMTFDNGFLSPAAFRNIRTITKALDVDHIFFTPGYQRMIRAFRLSVATDVYPLKSLERASAICNTCMYLAKAVILKEAIEKGIPLVAYGWSPGQAPVQASVLKLNAAMIRQNQDLMKGCLEPLMAKDIGSFMLGDEHYQLLAHFQEAFNGHFLYNVHPLAFGEYDEQVITGRIQELGWTEPDDTDSNSTNCLLNSFANRVHLDKLNFHPYAMENAGLVRNGLMSREEAFEKISRPMDNDLIDQISGELGVPDKTAGGKE